jgi:SAM-dependent methyltransferase
MLDKVKRKILGTDLEQKIELHKCLVDRIGIREKVDFVLAFYMVHEVPDQANLFKELKSLLKPGGQLYIIEPKFHVSGKAFDAMIQRLVSTGFEIAEKPGVFFSRAVLLTIMEL